MKAIHLTAYGNPAQNLRMVEVSEPNAPSAGEARCTVRWLAPSASAKAELDHDSPSARKASTAAYSPSTGGASTTTSRPPRGTSLNPYFVALTSANALRTERSRPTS